MESKNFKNPITIIILGILLFMNMKSWSQSYSDDGYLYVPDIFDTYCKESFIKDINKGNITIDLTAKSQRLWIVFSDRSNNNLYTKPIKGARKKSDDKLSFMERLVVKEVKGNWLHVYSLIYQKNGIIENNKERGWVSSSNLILSQYSVLNEKSAPKKALILLSISELKPSALNQKQVKERRFYNAPEAISLNKTTRAAKKFTIYFIIKETPDMLLLSQIDKIEGSQTILTSRVPGWMPRINITPWDHRVCLEPSYGQDVLDEYNGNDTILVFNDQKKYIDKFLADPNFDITGAKENIIKKISLTEARQDPIIMRMPILDNYGDNSEIKRVASIASIGGKNDDINEVAIKKKIQTLKEASENIDILFVVDATESMKNYYKAVANSIQNIIKNNDFTGSGAQLRFGLAIYRDYADGDDAFNIQPLTTDFNKVIAMATTVSCMSKDNDIPEAQYYGLVQGVQQAGFIKGHSNVVVLVGDAGNHQPDPKGYTVEKVVNVLANYEASFLAFQVKSGADDAFTNFNWDVQDILRKTANKNVNQGFEVRLQEINLKNTWVLKYADEGSEKDDVFQMFGRFTYASGNKPMSTDILEKNINQATLEFMTNVQEKVTSLENLLGGQNNGTFDKSIIKYLKKKGFTDSQIAFLMHMGDLTAKGFTATTMYNKDLPCLYPVVFLSADEKQNLDKILTNLVRGSASSTKKKKQFQEALLQQTKSMLGDASDEVILDKTLNDIWDIVLGIKFTGDIEIADKKLREMDKLDDDLFDDFYSDFSESVDIFIKRDFEDSRFPLAGQTFYWIPLNEFPGNE